MKLIKADEGQRYEAAHHFNYWSMNKVSPDNLSQRLNIGVSYFLPGGGAEISSSALERVYYCLEGEITVRGKNEEHQLKSGDMIYIASGEERSFQVSNNTPAAILVIMSKVN
jgi:quercetin dioxygenase-like cupin family protein